MVMKIKSQSLTLKIICAFVLFFISNKFHIIHKRCLEEGKSVSQAFLTYCWRYSLDFLKFQDGINMRPGA